MLQYCILFITKCIHSFISTKCIDDEESEKINRHDFIDSSSSYWYVKIYSESDTSKTVFSQNIKGNQKSITTDKIALNKGTYYIRVEDYYLSTMDYSLKVIDNSSNIAVFSVSLNKTSLTLNKGETATLKATVYPSNATNKTITWTTSNSGVAAVSNGKVTAKAAGTATITAKTANGKTASCKVSVINSTLKNTSVINSDIVQVGDKVRIAGSANSGAGGYKFAYYYKRSTNTKWNLLGTEFGTDSSVAFSPTTEATYDVKVIVKDNKSATVEKLFTVKAVKTLALTNVSVVSRTEVKLGTAIPMIGKAVGGKGPFTYAFYFKRSYNNKWNVLGKEFSSTASARLKPTAAGSYNIKIVVKDSTGKTVTKTVTATVK